ncbi:MAG: T9SS type A sorting domain-containing protein [Ignavibacteria bacterium]|nr:T9SS type A sorting domain-containing protein [Ignavibacteria bacterium]
MRKLSCFALFLLFLVNGICFSAPKISFQDLLTNAESNTALLKEARALCASLNQPFEIYTNQRVIIAAKGIEDGKVVYAVIKNAARIYDGAEVMFYDAVVQNYDLAASKIVYADGRIVDNTNGLYDVVLSHRNAGTKLLLVPEWTNDNVFAFDATTGDLVDNNFIPPSPSQLGSPKQALQTYNNKIVVSDQITDGVFMFDTSGTFNRLFAPAGGINNAILDNLRGIAFRPNKNLLVTVGSGTSQNTIQQFDTAGVSIGTFISTNVNSPFDILFRTNDILVSNSSGNNDVTKYNLDGSFNSVFITNSTLGFAQGIQKLPNGNITVCAFNGTGTGLQIYDSAGVYINTLTGVTGNRGSWRLPSGNFLVTNGGGIHEINGTTGTLIRTISASANFQFFGLYDPDLLVGVTPVQNTIASEYKLYNNYPNPFNPETNIRYSIPKKDFVSIKIYNSIGKEVSSYVNKIQEAGVYEIKFNANNLTSGVYYYKLTTNEFSETQKMILLK